MAPQWIESRSRYAHVSGVDPYIDLAFGTKDAGFFAAEGQSEWMSVLLLLKDIDPGDFADGRFYDDPAWSQWWRSRVRVPALYRHPAAGLGGQKYCTAYVQREAFLELLETLQPLQEAVARIALGQFLDADPPPEEDASQLADQAEPAGDPEPGTVVIGIIDDGIAFAHERFRCSPDETRVAYLWLQDGRPHPTGSPVPYGREIAGRQINDLLRRYRDEDEIYRRAEVIDFARSEHRSVARRGAHGTHVMDLACGYDFREESRRDRPIVCVQVPTATTADTSGTTLDDHGLDGTRYILDRADAIARERKCARLPVVINFSYGNVAGPHDGSSNLEKAIDDLIQARRTADLDLLNVVLPAGNSHLARLHAQHELGSKGRLDLKWRALPDDRTPSFLEIWLPKRPPDRNRIQVRIKPPSGAPSDWLEEDSGAGLRWAPNEEALCEVRYRYVPSPTERGVFLCALQPTKRLEPGPIAPSGIWTVQLENDSPDATDLVEAWIQRDDTPYGFRRRGRQSYFDVRCYERFDTQGREIEEDADQPPCHVKRAGSMNAIATGRETVVVGGYLRKELRPAEYSAGGPVSPAATSGRRGPDGLAVSDHSIVHRGVLAAGARSGSVVALNGTSVAAPQVTRLIADELAKQTPPVAAAPGKAPSHPPAGLSPIAGATRPPRSRPPGQSQPGPERVGAGLVEPPKDASRPRRLRVGTDHSAPWEAEDGA